VLAVKKQRLRQTAPLMNAKRIVPVAVVLTLAGVAAVIAFWPTCPGQMVTSTSGNLDQASEDYVKATTGLVTVLTTRH
jgi:hypothetical protein